MKTLVVVLSASLVLATPVIAGAQQLKQAQPVAPFQSINESDTGSRTLAPPHSARKTSVRSDASQRDSSPSVGTAIPTETTSTAKQISTQPKRTSATPVTDPRGQIVNGAVQVSPNQVMDPRTGRVYPTVPAGDGQRIVGPMKK